MAADSLPKLRRYLEELTRQLPTEAQGAMPQIQGIERRLLALRGYLLVLARRGGGQLRQRWAWTQGQFDSFSRSAAGQSMRNEVNAVIRYFNAHSPGHRLATATMHRSLETQISLWNRNASVGRIGQRLQQLALRELDRTHTVGVTPPYLQPQQSRPGVRQSVVPPQVPERQPLYPLPPTRRETPPYLMEPRRSGPSSPQSVMPPKVELPGTLDPASLERFRKFLIAQRLENPTNATPGLSSHGQARAVDFVVFRGPVMILTTGGPDAWRASGFAQRLAEAVAAAGPHLSGPLQNPDEPWHYYYDR